MSKYTDFSRFMQSDDLKPFEFVNPYDIPQPETAEGRHIDQQWLELRKEWNLSTSSHSAP